MSWIRVINEAKATGKLDAIYDEMKKKRGKVSNIMKVHSLNPDAMQRHIDLYLALMFGTSKLSREERELIAVVASAADRCEYCIHHHSEALNHYWKDSEMIQKLIHDFRTVDLPERKHTMLEYVFKLTKTPEDIEKADVDVLREFGFLDEEILNINLITCYFNFVNRIALGLGVNYSENEIKGYKY